VVTDRNDDNGIDEASADREKKALSDLDEKVAEVTVLERKLAEIEELEKRIARLKELEYELAGKRAEHGESFTPSSDVGEDLVSSRGDHVSSPDEPSRPVRQPGVGHITRPKLSEIDDSTDEDSGYIVREYRRVMYQFSFIGIEFGVAVALGALGGRWLDNRWDTAPWMMLLGVALGLTAAGQDLYRLVKKAQKKSHEGVSRDAERSTSDVTTVTTEPPGDPPSASDSEQERERSEQERER